MLLSVQAMNVVVSSATVWQHYTEFIIGLTAASLHLKLLRQRLSINSPTSRRQGHIIAVWCFYRCHFL